MNRQATLLLFFFPPTVYAIGFFIHLYGLSRIEWHTASIWGLWVHFFMLVFNSMVIIGLFRKRWWGYYPCLVFSVYFSANQLLVLFIFLLQGIDQSTLPQMLLSLSAFIAMTVTTVILWKMPMAFGQRNCLPHVGLATFFPRKKGNSQ
ncbi:MAG: hypothetical protein JW795_05440 [Chitinivibrionales bacterium]|nr:hypothetical protein [Chitinivibrionales bacterium]